MKKAGGAGAAGGSRGGGKVKGRDDAKPQKLDPRARSTYDTETAALLRKAANKGRYRPSRAARRHSFSLGDASARVLVRRPRRRRSQPAGRTLHGVAAVLAADGAREKYFSLLRVNVSKQLERAQAERALERSHNHVRRRALSAPADDRHNGPIEVEELERRRKSMMAVERQDAYASLGSELGVEKETDTVAKELVDGQSYMEFLRPFSIAAYLQHQELDDPVSDRKSRRAKEKSEGISRSVDLTRKGMHEVPLEAWLLLSPAVHTLKFSRNRLTEIPDHLERWTALECLKLDYNQIARLPRYFGQYGQGLVELNLSGNQLAGLPESFALLTSLEHLLLSGNYFTTVPNPVASCTRIQKIALRGNQLTTATALGSLVLLTSCSMNKNPPLVHLPIELGACTSLTQLEFDAHVVFPPEEVWRVSREHLMSHLAHLLEARRTHTVDASRLKLRSLGTPLCDETHLTHIDASINKLQALPPQISALSNVASLLLGTNELTCLPSEFGGLTALTQLDLERNLLASLPATLGQLTGLRTLLLAQNRLVALPLSFRYLSRLRTLTLASNPLEQPPADVACAGAVHAVQYMGALHALLSGGHVNLARAGLQYFPLVLLEPPPQEMAGPLGLGDLEGLYGIFPPPIEHLSLDGNKLRALPAEEKGTYLTGPVLGNSLKVLELGLSRLSSVITLSCSGNRMTSVPPSVACLTRLTRLNADNNLICEWDEVPSWPVENLRSLATVSLADNQLVELPLAIRKLRALRHLCLDANFVTRLPVWLGESVTLTSLSANNNHLSALPEEIGRLSALRELQLSGNAISDLPERLFLLTNLTRLRLSRNRIGALSRDVARLKCLTELSISSNRLKTLPPSLSSLPGLEALHVQGNADLLPSLPEGILARSTEDLKAFLRRLHVQSKVLDISTLGLTEVPIAIIERPNIHTLVLARNQLSTLPTELAALSGVKAMDLSDNIFEELPEILLAFSSLTDLKIAGNPLPHIPREILEQGSMCVLEMMRRVRESRVTKRLDLSKLGLKALPDQLLGYTYVSDLCIDTNAIEKLPEALCWSLPSLTRLSARGNKLTSPLPLRMWLLSSLTSIDLAQNKLVSLPVGFALLTRLRNLATASNPLNLPTSALLSRGLQTTMSFLRELSDLGLGMRQTQFLGNIPGMAGTLELAPFARPEGAECVLVQDGKRSGLSLKEAMSLARSGATVLLRPGTYKDILCFSVNGVTVGGDAAVEDVVIKATGGNDQERGMPPAAVVCRAFDCQLINVTVIYSGILRDSSAILVQAGSLTVKNCIVHNGVGNGVTVRRGMDVHIEGNRVHDCGGAGISLEQDVHAQVRYNDIVRCGSYGVQLCEGANPLIECNRIAKGKASGVLISLKGRGIIRNNEILLNARAGVEIRGESDPVVEKNKLAKNLIGMIVVEGGRGKLLDNAITESVSAGISVMSRGRPEIIGNRIKGAVRATGLLLLDSAHTPISDFEAQGMEIGIVAAEGSQAKITRARVFHMTTSGVIVRGRGTKLEFVEGEIFGNGGTGIEVKEAGTATLIANSVQHNGVGVTIDADCGGSMIRNVVEENTMAQIVSHAPERRFVIG